MIPWYHNKIFQKLNFFLMVNLDSLEKVINKNHNKVFKVEPNYFF